MPSRNRYNLVDDSADSRVPLHNDEVFQHGIHFQAKYIGSMDIPRPSSRTEIVAAMRRIRYEFKAKNIKKKKVNMVVSVGGVTVILRKKQKRKEWTWDESKMLVMHDPVYRIFYVSHDSQDLKIFSYIARDGSSNTFRCNVFKSKKKTQAMRIVRTIGQAFEVCHKLSLQAAEGHMDKRMDNYRLEIEENGKSEDTQSKGFEVIKAEHISAIEFEPLPVSACEQTFTDVLQSLSELNMMKPGKTLQELEETRPHLQSPGRPHSLSPTPLADHHHLQFLQQQVLQQQQQAQVAVAQVQLLKDQIAAETAARMEAQARSHQLLLQNRDLLQHVALLVQHVSKLETKASGHAKNQDWESLSACSLSLNLKNLYSSEEPITSTPAEDLQIPCSPFCTMACAESYLSLLRTRTPRIVTANKPRTGGRNSILTELPMDRWVCASAAVKEIIPKLDPPPPPISRKRRNRTGSETTSSFSPDLSKDSGMRSDIKPSRQDPFEDHTFTRLSISSFCSSLPEDCPLDGTSPQLTSPDSYGDALVFSSPFNKTCLHISLSEDELLEDDIFATESPLSSSLS